MTLNSIINNAIDVHLYSTQDKGWIQPSISQVSVPISNETIINGIYAATSTVKNIRFTETDQSWFWSKEWQILEAEADKDIAEGRFTSHDSMDDFIADLDN